MVTQLAPRIVSDPKVLFGKPVIKGTRITVELVLRLLAQGMTAEEIFAQYPHIAREDIFAAYNSNSFASMAVYVS